ncbi:MAG TPA: hypothetical protein VHQ65_06010 [Thermoanaerobaculia bacterium]|nr:hypothetical protein [Thermoanaerobaculia bacterium]
MDLSSTARGRLLLATTLFVPLLAALPYGGWLMAAVAPSTIYGWFARRVRFGDALGAWGLGLAWAGLLSLGTILLVYLWPEAARGIVHGEPYREEMFRWIATGEGMENDPSRFIPQHLLHLTVFVLLTWASAGYLGLALGALLVAYMSYFVGSYAVAADALMLGPLVAWVPWSVLRVGAFVLLGVVFTRPLLERRPWPFTRRDYGLLALALSGIVGDLVIKATAAPAYGRFLRQLGGF